MPIVEDLIKDWTTVPFVSIRVADACNENEDEVFTIEWPGTVRGCKDGDSALPRTDWKASGKKLVDCKEIDVIGPIQQPVLISGKHICGQRGGEAFEDATRVDPETGSCPEGTMACSDPTTDEEKANVICQKDVASCPITSLKVAATSQELIDAKYDALTIEEGVSYLGYRKTADKRPLSLTYVGT